MAGSDDRTQTNDYLNPAWKFAVIGLVGGRQAKRQHRRRADGVVGSDPTSPLDSWLLEHYLAAGCLQALTTASPSPPPTPRKAFSAHGGPTDAGNQQRSFINTKLRGRGGTRRRGDSRPPAHELKSLSQLAQLGKS